MTNVEKTNNGWTTAMRWVARLVGLVAAGLFVLFAVELGAKILPALPWTDPQGMPLLIVLLAALAGVLVAWRWELLGGILTFAGALGIMALVCTGSGADMLYCAFLFAAPLLLVGALLLGCCWRNRTKVSGV